MPEPTHISNVISVTYMAERFPNNADQGVHYYRVATVVNSNGDQIAHMESVVDSVGHGQHWFFCGDCSMVFACNASCPKCGRSVRAEKRNPDQQPDGLVQTMHSPAQG